MDNHPYCIVAILSTETNNKKCSVFAVEDRKGGAGEWSLLTSFMSTYLICCDHTWENDHYKIKFEKQNQQQSTVSPLKRCAHLIMWNFQIIQGETEHFENHISRAWLTHLHQPFNTLLTLDSLEPCVPLCDDLEEVQTLKLAPPNNKKLVVFNPHTTRSWEK